MVYLRLYVTLPGGLVVGGLGVVGPGGVGLGVVGLGVVGLGVVGGAEMKTRKGKEPNKKNRESWLGQRPGYFMSNKSAVCRLCKSRLQFPSCHSLLHISTAPRKPL